MAKNKDEIRTEENSTETPAEAKEEVKEFPVDLSEFLAGNKKIESSRAFMSLMQAEGFDGQKPRAEWQRLFALFQNKPTGTKWADWLSKNQGGNY